MIMKKIISAFVFIVAFVPSIFSQSTGEWYDDYDFSSVAPSGQTLYYEYYNTGYPIPCVSIILPCWRQFGQYGQGREYGYGDHEKPSGSLIIPEEVTHDGVTYKVKHIDDDAFNQCPITSVTINIEFGYCFQYHSTLETVVFGDSIIELEGGFDAIFKGCDNLSSITLGKSVQNIRNAFKGLTHLTTIISKAEIPPQCASDCFEGVPAYADIIVPCGAAYRYELADYWKDFTRITEDCSAIGDVDDLQDIHVCVLDGCIVVEGVNNMEIDLFDMTGRLVGSTKDNRINVPTNGTYMLKIGNHPARKVVVIR